MEIGAFTMSLSVKDLRASKEFYEKLGFKERAGKLEENWLVLKNGEAVIGLFQGMFEGNLLTFVPGWDQDGQALAEFTDIREIRKELLAQGLAPETDAEIASAGPAHFYLRDPDGNRILFDQYV